MHNNIREPKWLRGVRMPSLIRTYLRIIVVRISVIKRSEFKLLSSNVNGDCHTFYTGNWAWSVAYMAHTYAPRHRHFYLKTASSQSTVPTAPMGYGHSGLGELVVSA